MKKVRLLGLLCAFSIVFCSNSSLLASASGNSKQRQSEINHTMSCNYANIKVGCDYLYGASGPYMFDCGGLVRYISKLVGVTLTSDSAAEDFKQYETKNRGYANRSSNCKAGDFLYYKELDDKGNVIKNGRYRDIYHASVFVGNGQIIDASSKKGKVVKRPRSTFKTASEVGYADAATVF